MTNRERVLNYVLKNPNATVARITEDLKISTTSVTQHHLVHLRLDGLLPEKVPLRVQRALKYKDLLIKATNDALKELNKIIKNEE